MRVLIADDEPFARDRLRQLLLAHPEFELIAEAGDGAETLRLTASLKPDLLFLDIQMGGTSGLDVAACLPLPRPAIIFCTAYEQHAVDAFELQVVDYLLKPVSRARLAQSLQRLSSKQPQPPTHTPLAYLTRLLVRTGNHYTVVPAAQVCCFEALDGLTRLTTLDGHHHWLDLSLQELDTQLDPRRFYRISRNAILWLGAILELHPLPGGAAEAVLRQGARFEVSRRRYRGLVTAIEKA
ncbi:MAG: response regulator transcription factor [Bryobacterales bacterium]|nr:response regulator transcription factor [Bryobacterales bacterium]